ncbi:MAG: C25 family cysteine peptidase, partial [candidate division WOR-3 bacterium]|nr:C25 family cysteine peptidase [candidate division WOR-3 bacterium]
KLYPVQVNPVRGEIAVVRRLVVRVSYSGGSYPPSVARWMMPIYAQGVANFGSLVLSTTGESDDHVKYLVFRHSNYDSNVWLNDSLIGWAHRRGYRTRVVQADGLSAGQIKDTIKAEYGLPGSQHALRFVLLVGGADEVATKRGYTREGWEGEEVGLSDHWYSEIMRRSGGAEEYGEDCYPEVTVARLVPSSNDNLICQVKKIVEYEKRPVVENDWLREMLMVGWGWRYAHPFVAMWRDVNETPSFFDYYDPTRTQLRGRWGNDYNTNYDVACEIDSGKGIVCYAGHGMCDRWWEWNEIPDGDTHYHESWTSTNVQALQNDSLNPVVFNVACSTSAFDQQSCLCNAWMQEYPAGAAATYGATQSSHNDPNFLQCTTLVRTLCDTMRIVGENIYVAPASLLGDVDMTIDANVALHYGGGWDGSNEFMYMLMGDPAMPIWTGGVPDTAVLTYPADFPCGSYLFSITVEVMGRPVEGAHVCLMREPDVYVTGWTNWEGVAGLQVNAQDTGSIYLTVSEGHALGDKPHTPILPFQGTVRASGWTWSEVAQVPPRPSGRAVKDGGCLAYDAGTDLIYASKGYKTGDFYAYDVPTDSWTRKWSIPPSVEGKQVYKGSVICSDGNGKLYLTRGNNTNDFWEYDAATDSWVQKSDVPYGESGKRVKQGAGIAWAGGAAYLLKGYRNEFYKYDPGTGEWTTLTPAPVGWHMKWDAGSWLVSDGDHTVYAFKGKYHEFYTYNINTGAWSAPKHAMPIPGHAGNKKAKDGSCAAWFSGDIYALKGGNTTEYWHYFPLADTWIQEADIPRYGSSGRRKSVKQGSALAAYPGTGLFALKGNKTFEFWRYVPGPSGGSETVEWYASGGGRVVASGGPTLDGEQPLTDGLEASKPRWNWQGTMVCYSKTDRLTEREQIYQCHYGLPIPELRVVDMDEVCVVPVYSPSGQYFA